MRSLLATILLAAFTQFAVASEGGLKLQNANVNLSDQASLQRGAKMFVNYCVSCHSAQYMRYNRVAADLGIPEDVMKANLMFTTDKVGEPMLIAMRPDDGQAWFGVTPPDLSVVARSRGADWLYSYLNGFYLDPKRVSGVNNLYFPNGSYRALSAPYSKARRRTTGRRLKSLRNSRRSVRGPYRKLTTSAPRETSSAFWSTSASRPNWCVTRWVLK